ncbi:MAG TPA: SDR family oxidoreductase [Gemmatimonadales bacterium]|nr:SDR family oxidoreductase [Gemmatimonadales bacterium]
MPISLATKSALVTGGGRGIGRAIATRLAEAGAAVAIASRKLEVLQETARELAHLPGRVHPIACHVGRKDQLERAVRETESVLGPIDILVNNSATNVQMGPALEASDEQLDKMVEVNLKAAFRLVNLVAPGMIARGNGGSIINLVSVSGLTPQPGGILYSMTKAALIMLTKAWARELGPHRIRVNAIAPGLIQTEFSEHLWNDPVRRRQFAGDQVLPHLGQPQEVGAAALFLASEEASFVTGQVLVVDGGLLI